MKSTTCRAALFLLVLCTPLARAAEPQLAPLESFSIPGYTIFAHDAAQAQIVATNLKIIDRVLSSMIDRPLNAAAPATNVILLRRSEWKHYLRMDADRRAELMPDRLATYLLLPSDVPEARLRAAVFHQGAHLFLRRHFAVRLPLWFDEGFALVMQGTRIDDARATIGADRFWFNRQSNPDMLDKFEARSKRELVQKYVDWLPFDRLLHARETSPAVDRESWAIVHKGLIADPSFGKQLFAYVQAIGESLPEDQAAQRSFGMDIASVERRVRRYTEREDFPDSKLKFDAPIVPTLDGRRAVGDGEALAILSQLVPRRP